MLAAVVYAKAVVPPAAFYGYVFCLTPTQSEAGFAVLRRDDAELTIVQARPERGWRVTRTKSASSRPDTAGYDLLALGGPKRGLGAAPRRLRWWDERGSCVGWLRPQQRW